jgi:hypothetical protein
MAWGENQWRHHVLASLLCWLATYTVAYGLVAFLASALVAQLFSPSPRRMDRFTLFWAVNVALVLVVYIPGLPDLDGGLPSPGSWLAFTLAYLGSPAAGLIWFPFESQFDLPHATSITARNVVTGFILVTAIAARAYGLLRVRDRSPAARAFSLFALFAVGAAVLTGMGRAHFDEYGVANANASRFVLFGSYVLYACLYDGARGSVFRSPLNSRWSIRLRTAAALLLLACATLTYARSWKVYAQARHFDQLLQTAYAVAPAANPFDHLIYPFQEEIPGYKATLRRLRVGPYRDAADDRALQRLAKNKLTDEFGINGLRAGLDGLILFAHPHSRFSLDADSDVTSVTFRYGILREALSTQPPTDGVEFRVWMVDETSEQLIWSIVWRPASATALEQPVTLSLPRHRLSGTLVFETLTAGHYENDWAYWTDLMMWEDR